VPLTSADLNGLLDLARQITEILSRPWRSEAEDESQQLGTVSRYAYALCTWADTLAGHQPAPLLADSQRAVVRSRLLTLAECVQEGDRAALFDAFAVARDLAEYLRPLL
jgi:hypothetical protein